MGVPTFHRSADGPSPAIEMEFNIRKAPATPKHRGMFILLTGFRRLGREPITPACVVWGKQPLMREKTLPWGRSLPMGFKFMRLFVAPGSAHVQFFFPSPAPTRAGLPGHGARGRFRWRRPNITLATRSRRAACSSRWMIRSSINIVRKSCKSNLPRERFVVTTTR